MGLIAQTIFYLLAVTLIFSVIMVILAHRIAYSILFAFITFVLFGMLYFTLNAPLNAIVQIMIYGVAVSILLVIAFMLTNYDNEKQQVIHLNSKFLFSFIGILAILYSFISVIISNIENGETYLIEKIIATPFNTIPFVSVELLTGFAYAFELVSVFILVAIVGIVSIISYNDKEKK